MTLLRWLSDLQLGDDQVGHFESPGYQAAGMKYFMFGSLENPDPIRVQGSILDGLVKPPRIQSFFQISLLVTGFAPETLLQQSPPGFVFFRVFVGDAYFLTFI